MRGESLYQQGTLITLVECLYCRARIPLCFEIATFGDKGTCARVIDLRKVSFIASEAEFTPKQIQTKEERVKMVYRIKVDVENPARELKSNMPVDAEIPL